MGTPPGTEGPPPPPAAGRGGETATQPPGPAAPGRPGTSGLAVASLVLGIAGFTCLFFLGSILAIIFGFLARSEIKKSGGMKRGSGLATAGIVLGFVAVALILISAAVLIPLSFVGVGPTRTVSRSVTAGPATAVEASLTLDKGDLDVTGGGPDLMQGTFTYNSSRWKPTISYDVSGPAQPGQPGPTGDLVVRQDAEDWWRFWQWLRGRNSWDVRLGGSVPIDLRVDQSWGESDFDMAGAPLSGFRVNSSAGDIEARLPGTMAHLREVGVDQSAGLLELDMDGNYPEMERLTVRNSAGNVRVDLSGRWGKNVTGTIRNSAGSIRVILPREVGVHVTARVSSGRIDVRGLQSRGGGVYVNGAWGSSPVGLTLDVRNSAGTVILELE